MPSIELYNTSNEAVGSIDLDDTIFGVEVKEHLFHAAVRDQMAKRRAGTHATKGRAQVSGCRRGVHRGAGLAARQELGALLGFL